jgi:hypothetical protein
MAPSGEEYKIDWVISNSSNVHVANHRDWFTSFTSFDTYCGQFFANSRLEVAGIGTVQLNVKLHNGHRARQKGSRIITLHNVLYAPGSICNIFGQPDSSAYRFHSNFSPYYGMLLDEDGNRAGIIEWAKLPRLRLRGHPRGYSSLDPNREYMINALWPDTERARWEAHQARRQIIPVRRSNGNEPYSTEEKAWLNKHYGGEFHFLRTLGLSIWSVEDRDDGRSIVRSWMAEDGGEPVGEKSRGGNVSMAGMDLDDDADDFLREIEDDPMSHLADFNFSTRELKWIQQHHRYSSFMLSYGLNPFKREDCNKAKAIIDALMGTIMKTD